MSRAEDQERIEELVAEYLERREAGEALSTEAFAAAHPAGGEALRSALRAALETEALFPDSTSLLGRPERIGPWRVLGELGRGGAGRVFRVAREGEPDRVFALKVLDLALFGGARALERFRREGAALERLEHESIVRVREVAVEAERPYLVMDLVEGPSLSQVLSAARVELRTSRADTPPTDVIALPGEGTIHVRAARLAAELARAVEFAHRHSLLHRDLKPSNVLLGANGRPVLADFGLAAHEGSATLTASGDVLGTPNYMSPEQARGERADPRTDVWGLGAVLYELLTLRPPHGGEETLEVLERIRRRPVAPVRRVNPAVPPALARIVHRALAWRASRRYASAAALAADLDAFALGRAPAARARGPLEWAEDTLRFHPRLAGAAALVAFAAVLGTAAVRGSEPVGESLAQLERQLDRTWLDGDLADLEEPASRLLEVDPSSARGRAFLQLATGEPLELTGDEAVDTFAQAALRLRARDFDAALALTHQALDADPDWVLPIALKGLASLEKGEREVAERELLAARRLLPESLAVTCKLAYVLRRAGRPDEAVDELERILVAHPNDVEAWSDLSASLGAAQRPEEALVAIEKALSLGEPTAKMLNRKGAILDGLGRGDEAQEIFRALLDRSPDSATVMGNLAYALDGDCLLTEAREAYRRVLEVEPRNLKAHTGLAHMAAGSMRDTCSACQRAFAADPTLYDPDLAVAHTVKLLEVDRGETSWIPGFAVSIAHRVERADEIHVALEALIADEGEVDARVVRIERALRKL